MAQELPMRTVWRYALATALNVVPYAILVPLVVVRLSEAGASAVAVGVYGLMPFAAVLAVTAVAPRLHAALGIASSYRLGLAATTLAVAATVFAGSYAALCLCNAVLGAGAALLWTGTEALIARNAPPGRVGRATGLYQAGLGTAFAAGPFVPPALGLDFAAAGGVAIGIAALAWVPVATLPRRGGGVAPASPEPLSARAVRLVPGLALAAFAGGLFETGLGAAAPVQALALGWAEPDAAMLVGVIAVGSLLLQMPVGRLADRMPTDRLAAAALALLLAAGLGLLGARAVPGLLWALAFVWGAAGGALYTLSMIAVGREHRSDGTLGVTAAVVAAFTAGAVVGPLLAGLALDLAPRSGLAVLLAATAGLVGGLLLVLGPRAGPPTTPTGTGESRP